MYFRYVLTDHVCTPIVDGNMKQRHYMASFRYPNRHFKINGAWHDRFCWCLWKEANFYFPGLTPLLLVHAIRNIEKALGNGIKKPSPSELKNKLIARKSIVAARNIRKGESFTEENLTVKRPGTGVSPMRWDEVIGQIAQKDYKEDELIWAQ